MKLVTAVLGSIAVIVGSIFAVAMYTGVEVSIREKSEKKSEWEIIVSYVNKPGEAPTKVTPEPAVSPVAVEPTPTVAPPEESVDAGQFSNITDLWFSEGTAKTYFIEQRGIEIEVFEDDERGQRVSRGTGSRIDNEVTFQFFSELDEVNGAAKFELAPDGKSMKGRFKSMSGPTKDNQIRLVRFSA